MHVLDLFLVTDEELAKAPEGFETKKAAGKALADYNYRIQVSTYGLYWMWKLC